MTVVYEGCGVSSFTFDSGKKIFLTEEEYKELMDMRHKEEKAVDNILQEK